ncbi:MAG: hypothetical protein WA722_13450, partial [Candidatus Sulfotelmatobacter sp.]
MNRINLFRNLPGKAKAFRTTPFHGNPATQDSVTWGKTNLAKTNFDKTSSTLVFAALLIVCSVAVGCSSDKPQPANSTSQVAMTQPMPPIATPAIPAPVAAKPVHKKAVRKAPVIVTYEGKVSGVSFRYPRKDSLETGDAANQLVSSDAVPMDFVQPGGVAIAAVALPTSVYP